jgi:hypothetical protein
MKNEMQTREGKTDHETDGGGVVPIAFLLRLFDRLQEAMARLSGSRIITATTDHQSCT